MESFNISCNDKIPDELVHFLDNTSVFAQPWWLQAVSPNKWGLTVIRKGNEVIAVWPYTFKLRIGIYKIQDLPLIYYYQGPWLRISNAKYCKKLSEEKEILNKLIDELPYFDLFKQWFNPGIKNWLPLYWKGYRQTTRYTYIIEKSKEINEVWMETRENIKTDIKKAEKKLMVKEENNLENLKYVITATYKRQGLDVPFSFDLLERIDVECCKRDVRKVLSAQDENGKIHAAVYMVWDKNTVYAILRGTEPELRNSGANAFLIWHAIKFALSVDKNFDFAGSWIESLERFTRAFGAKQIPFFEISKNRSKVLILYRNLRKWI